MNPKCRMEPKSRRRLLIASCESDLRRGMDRERRALNISSGRHTVGIMASRYYK